MQKFSIGVDFSVLAAVASLVFWVGGQSEEQEQTKIEVQKLVLKTDELSKESTRASGQLMQMAGTDSVASVVNRVAVVETKVDAQEEFTREMKNDLVNRLTRIENKIDNSR